MSACHAQTGLDSRFCRGGGRVCFILGEMVGKPFSYNLHLLYNTQGTHIISYTSTTTGSNEILRLSFSWEEENNLPAHLISDVLTIPPPYTGYG